METLLTIASGFLMRNTRGGAMGGGVRMQPRLPPFEGNFKLLLKLSSSSALLMRGHANDGDPPSGTRTHTHEHARALSVDRHLYLQPGAFSAGEGIFTAQASGGHR